jgi:hypothetical protein
MDERNSRQEGLLNAILFKSERRQSAFAEALARYGVACEVLDFGDPAWLDYDFRKIDIAIYFPAFEYSSNHPLALYKVQDNLRWIHEMHPHIQMFPDPAGIYYYNDKYRQYLCLKGYRFPTPDTLPLVGPGSLAEAERTLGFPLVLKNRFGAGGGAVFRVTTRSELRDYYNLATMNLFSRGFLRHLSRLLLTRETYFQLIKLRRAEYPFLSPPLLAQRFVRHDRDIKTVVGDFEVVEAHWRRKASSTMWKVNIDGGGIGEWGFVPEPILRLSCDLARRLNVRWLNLDLLVNGEALYISEFSPVWHHYRYKEQESFVYKDDYNIPMPLDLALILEEIIVRSLVAAAKVQSVAAGAEGRNRDSF